MTPTLVNSVEETLVVNEPGQPETCRLVLHTLCGGVAGGSVLFSVGTRGSRGLLEFCFSQSLSFAASKALRCLNTPDE